MKKLSVNIKDQMAAEMDIIVVKDESSITELIRQGISIICFIKSLEAKEIYVPNKQGVLERVYIL